MKMVKSLLLGSAAGLVAVAGAQAADLPVKAKPVDYVKVCSLYGAGFYYIPGTDTCIKIGGYVRYEAYHNGANGGNISGVTVVNAANPSNRHTNTWAQQARFRMTGDVRTQTEYGTLRAYFAFGLNAINAAAEVAPAAFTTSMERAFIQFAGFTIGRSDTFFAFYNGAAYGLLNGFTGSTSGPGGQNVFAYTWQFGGGLSASISLEDQISRVGGAGVLDINTGGLYGAFAAPAADVLGQRIPDLVGNIRVDQAWGSAQIMGALHENGGRYYTGGCVAGGLANSTACGNPGSEYGWAVGAGLTLKMPWNPLNTFSVEAAYSEGALRYISGLGTVELYKSGGLAFGPYTDAIFATPGFGGQAGQLELTEGWAIAGAYEHYWTPTIRQSFEGQYGQISYSDGAKAMITGTGNCASIGAGATAGSWTNCNPDWSWWHLRTRVMWNPVPNLDVGVEVIYRHIDTAFAGSANFGAAGPGGGLAGGSYVITDQNVWTAAMRVQRSFWP